MKKLIIATIVSAAAIAAYALTYGVANFCGYPTTATLSGTTYYPNSVSYFPGSTNTVTLVYNAAYQTNVVITNQVGVAQNLGSTNQGMILSTWNTPTPVVPDERGQVAIPAISITYINSSSGRTASTLNFARSSDGQNYDTNTFFAVSLANATTANTISTNVPSWIVTGSKKIILYDLVSGTNTVTTDSITLYNVSLTGWAP